MNKPKVSYILLDYLVYENDWFENDEFLESLGYDYPKDLSEQEKYDLVEGILNQYEIVDFETIYYDLEKAYEEIRVIFKYNNQLWGCSYTVSHFHCWGECDEPFLVKPIEITITKYKRI